MKVNFNYSKWQELFNNSLCEWYKCYSQGACFYIKDPPGIVFTRTRGPRVNRDKGKVVKISEWYFTPEHPRAKNTALSFSGGAHTLLLPSTLHIGYENWYSKFLGVPAVVEDANGLHVAFCNYYDVAFNTLCNYARAKGLDADYLETFGNFRLLTGNLHSVSHLFNEPIFHSVILHVNTRNAKCLLRPQMVETWHRMLINDGVVALVSGSVSLLSECRRVFSSHVGDAAWLELPNASVSCDPKLEAIISNLNRGKYITKIPNDKSIPLTGQDLTVVIYRKLRGKKPNASFNGPVFSLA